jgi:hypothetical protein
MVALERTRLLRVAEGANRPETLRQKDMAAYDHG